eukprot:12041309-Alexandrium_andersonii.AAC.1
MAYNEIHIVASLLPVGCASACYERVRTPAHAHVVAECAAPQVSAASSFGYASSATAQHAARATRGPDVCPMCVCTRRRARCSGHS